MGLTRFLILPFSGTVLSTVLFAAAPPSPIPEASPSVQEAFRKAAEQFLAQENLSLNDVRIEFKSLREDTSGTSGGWRALARVYVDAAPGGYAKRLVFDRDVWLNPQERRPFADHRWSKLMWHEIHHLNAFPVNLRRAHELMRIYPPAATMNAALWERKWILLLEPMEELDAERTCLERYRDTFGPVPDSLMADSRADMRKHAARYQQMLKILLSEARTPRLIRATFPARLPIDADGSIQ